MATITKIDNGVVVQAETTDEKIALMLDKFEENFAGVFVNFATDAQAALGLSSGQQGEVIVKGADRTLPNGGDPIFIAGMESRTVVKSVDELRACIAAVEQTPGASIVHIGPLGSYTGQ